MEGDKIVKITNTKQFECLVELMEKNPNIAKGYFSFGSSKSEYNSAWKIFAQKLNSLGPPVRDGTGWQKVWNDFKGKIKKKMSQNKKEIVATRGGSCRLLTLSPLENQFKRKSFELKQKNFEGWKQTQMEKKKSSQEKLALKIQVLDYKQKKLALEESRYAE